jgi:hypothetical protein
VVEVGLGHRNLFNALPVNFIGNTYWNLFDAAKDIQLCQEYVREAIDPRCVTSDWSIKPAAATFPAGGGSNLATLVAQILVGPMPLPVVAPPEIGLEEVTNG